MCQIHEIFNGNKKEDIKEIIKYFTIFGSLPFIILWIGLNVFHPLLMVICVTAGIGSLFIVKIISMCFCSLRNINNPSMILTADIVTFIVVWGVSMFIIPQEINRGIWVAYLIEIEGLLCYNNKNNQIQTRLRQIFEIKTETDNENKNNKLMTCEILLFLVFSMAGAFVIEANKYYVDGIPNFWSNTLVFFFEFIVSRVIVQGIKNYCKYTDLPFSISEMVVFSIFVTITYYDYFSHKNWDMIMRILACIVGTLPLAASVRHFFCRLYASYPNRFWVKIWMKGL